MLDKIHTASSLVLPAVCTYEYTVKKEPADKKRAWERLSKCAKDSMIKATHIYRNNGCYQD